MTPPRPRVDPLQDSKSALLHAAEAAVAASPSPLSPPHAPGRSGRRGVLPLLVVVGTVSGALLLVQPSWLRTPSPAPEPPIIADASARVTLVREAERLKIFYDSTGHLPSTLSEAGGPDDGHVVYTPGPGGTFTLQIATDGHLILRSTDDLTQFVGTSYRSLTERSAR